MTDAEGEIIPTPEKVDLEYFTPLVIEEHGRTNKVRMKREFEKGSYGNPPPELYHTRSRRRRVFVDDQMIKLEQWLDQNQQLKNFFSYFLRVYLALLGQLRGLNYLFVLRLVQVPQSLQQELMKLLPSFLQKSHRHPCPLVYWSSN